MTTTTAKVSVLLVDDDDELLSSLAVLFGSSERLELGGTATNAREALAFCRAKRPHVVLADVRMPGLNGIALTRFLTEGSRQARPRVLVTTAFAIDEYLLAALGAGASGFVPKSSPWSEFDQALVTVHEGGIALPADLSAHLVELLLPGKPDLSVLSNRELEVLTLVGTGASRSQIAEALVLSEGTVRAHLDHLRIKLGARNRVDLALVARQAGLGFTPAKIRDLTEVRRGPAP